MAITLRIVRLPAAALLLAAVVYVIAAWQSPVDRLGERLQSAATALQGVAEAGDAPLLREIAEAGAYERVWIIEGSGIVSASSHSLEAGRKLDSPWLELLLSAGGSTVWEGRDWGSRKMFLAAHRSARTGRWSAVLEDGDSVRSGRQRLILLSICSALGTMLLLSAGTYLAIENKLLRPLSRLEEAAEDLLAGKVVRKGALGRLADVSPTGRIATALETAWRENENFAGRLKEQQALYFSVLNLAREMVLVASFEGIVLDVNRSICERLDLERSTVMGMSLKNLEAHLPAAEIVELGERSAQERRVFDRLNFSFFSGSGKPIHVVAAVQAVPYGGQAAFMLVADNREDAA